VKREVGSRLLPPGMSGVGETNIEARPGLPRAIEGLSCEQRILWATVRLVAEKGFDSVTIFDVTERADVSRADFYELFESKDECLFAAYEKVLDALVAYVARAYERDGPWPLRIRRAMEACLEACSAEPEVARMTTVDAPATSPEAQHRYRNALERFVPLFIEGREYAASSVHLPPDLERMAVGGAVTIIFDEVVAGRAQELPAKLPDILFTVLAPYIGPEAAVAEVRRAERD
jgi:AcrR family transcriptional regulator